jgi:hypothetical protein
VLVPVKLRTEGDARQGSPGAGSIHQVKGYYSFEARFCNPDSDHEKGRVVGMARRNYMVPVPEVGSLEELNGMILRQCLAYGNHKISGRDRKVNELYEDENVQVCDGRADKYATVIVDKNR